jgi:histone H3/H4
METKATTTPPVPATNDVTFSQNQSSSATTTDDLPRAHVKRLMKHHLSQFIHVDSKTAQQFEPNIAKDALDGVQQACKIFIHYLTSTANDICAESKRSTLSAVRFVWVWWFFFRMDFEF